jgi:hypothetical protein
MGPVRYLFAKNASCPSSTLACRTLNDNRHTGCYRSRFLGARSLIGPCLESRRRNRCVASRTTSLHLSIVVVARSASITHTWPNVGGKPVAM